MRRVQWGGAGERGRKDAVNKNQKNINEEELACAWICMRGRALRAPRQDEYER